MATIRRIVLDVLKPHHPNAYEFAMVFLGRVSGISWWRSGIRTLLVGILTAALIFVFVR
jgi:hypothetical protein